LGESPFTRFLAFSDWLFETTGQTHRLALDRLYSAVFDGITTLFSVDIEVARDILSRDYYESGARGSPKFINQSLGPMMAATSHGNAKRQARHRRENMDERPRSNLG